MRVSTSHRSNDESRGRQLAVGLGILGVLILVVPAFYIVWRFVPGLFGEWLGVIAGVISTPFLLEIFFIVTGLIVVVGLNHVRNKREGDEFVYLEQVCDPGVVEDFPERSSFAVYRDRPLPGVEPSVMDEIEGALEIGDHDEATALFGKLGDAELKLPGVLALRLRLARETGKDDVARRIEGEIKASERG